MDRLFRERTGHDLEVISGYRTPEAQKALAKRGRPAAPVPLSNHTICPARGADLRIVGAIPSQEMKKEFGRAAEDAGLRWGGGSARDADGIPSDWNHVDLGPRRDSIAEQYRDALRRAHRV